MVFTTLQILLWDGSDCSEDDDSVLEVLYTCWGGLKGRQYMVTHEHGSTGRHSRTHVLNIYRFPDTEFRACLE